MAFGGRDAPGARSAVQAVGGQGQGNQEGGKHAVPAGDERDDNGAKVEDQPGGEDDAVEHQVQAKADHAGVPDPEAGEGDGGAPGTVGEGDQGDAGDQ